MKKKLKPCIGCKVIAEMTLKERVKTGRTLIFCDWCSKAHHLKDY